MNPMPNPFVTILAFATPVHSYIHDMLSSKTSIGPIRFAVFDYLG